MPRKLQDWLTSWFEYLDNTEPPHQYKLWVGLSVIASALQRKCRIEMGHLVVYPNLYTVLIGPSGTRKGTAMEAGRWFLAKKGIPIAADAATKEALSRQMAEISENENILVTEQGANHASMTIYSNEFTVLIGYNNTGMMDWLNDWYDCRDPWIYKTKQQGTDSIDAVWVNLIAATTPEIFRSAMPPELIGSGLSARTIFIYEEKKSKLVPIPFMTKKELALKQILYHDFEIMCSMNGKFKYQQDFIEAYVDLRVSDDINKRFEDPRMEGYLNRRPVHLLKLSMIIAASESEDMIISAKRLYRANEILEKAEKNMPLVFSGFGKSALADVMDRIWKTITYSGKKGVLLSELTYSFRNDVDSYNLIRIMNTLVGTQKFTIDRSNPGDVNYIFSEYIVESTQQDN